MGAQEDYQDAVAREDWRAAFDLARAILDRKGSKRLMWDWIKSCVEALNQLGKANLLPDHFDRLSVYGQREELNKLRLE